MGNKGQRKKRKGRRKWIKGGTGFWKEKEEQLSKLNEKQGTKEKKT